MLARVALEDPRRLRDRPQLSDRRRLSTRGRGPPPPLRRGRGARGSCSGPGASRARGRRPRRTARCGQAEVARGARQAVAGEAGIDVARHVVASPRSHDVKRLPTPASSPWCAVPGKRWSIAWRISWSPPEHGREEPAVAIARPESTSASASAIRKSSSSMPSWRCSRAVAAVRAKVTARPSTGSPRSRRRQPPVRDRRQVGDDVADPRAAHLRVARAHVVEVDDDGDRHLHAEGRLAAVLLERGHRRGDAVVGEARRDRDHRQAAERRGVLGRVERLAAADPDDGVEEPRAQARAQLRRRLDRAALDHPDVGVGELRAQDLGDLLALPGPDRDRRRGRRSRSGGRRAAAPGRRRRRRPMSMVRGDPDHPAQQRHATSRARSRSAWSSTSTHSSPPTDATPTRPPRSLYSWKPSS